MKLLVKILVILTIIVFIPASSYAIIDFGVYGGYAWGDFEPNGTYDIDGSEYGFIGHFNGGVPLLISVGVGLFWQSASHTVEIDSKDYDADRESYGFDAYAQLELPIVIHPYIRGGIAIKEELDLEGSKFDDKFNQIYYGIGVAMTVFPMIQVFGEWIHTESTIEDGEYEADINTDALHVGARVSI